MHTSLITTSRSLAMRRLLALATLAAAGTVSATAAWAGPGERGMRGEAFGAPALNQRMLEKVGASAEQRAQITQIMDAARTDLRAQREEGRNLHMQMRELFTQPSIDEAAVESLRQQMLARHDAASQRMTQAMLEASRVLTVEQRQQIAALMAERSERRADGHRGRHDADGRRHGG